MSGCPKWRVYNLRFSRAGKRSELEPRRAEAHGELKLTPLRISYAFMVSGARSASGTTLRAS